MIISLVTGGLYLHIIWYTTPFLEQYKGGTNFRIIGIGEFHPCYYNIAWFRHVPIPSNHPVVTDSELVLSPPDQPDKEPVRITSSAFYFLDNPLG